MCSWCCHGERCTRRNFYRSKRKIHCRCNDLLLTRKLLAGGQGNLARKASYASFSVHSHACFTSSFTRYSFFPRDERKRICSVKRWPYDVPSVLYLSISSRVTLLACVPRCRQKTAQRLRYLPQQGGFFSSVRPWRESTVVLMCPSKNRYKLHFSPITGVVLCKKQAVKMWNI